MLSPIEGFVTTEAPPAPPSVQFQVLPHNIDAEAALLGALLIDPDQMLEVNYLKPEDFFISAHRFLYAAIHSLFERNGNYDYVTVCEQLDAAGHLSDFGGPGGVSDIMLKSFMSMNAPRLAEIVYRDSVSRQVIEKCTGIVQAAYERNTERSGEILVNQSVSALSEIDAVRNVSSGPQNMRVAIGEFMDEIEAIQAGKLAGLPTGIKDIDRLFGGFERGHNYLLAGRPGMGKSGLALQIAHNLAKQGKRILIFSLEMSRKDQVGRLIAQICKIPYADYKTGKVDDWACIVRAANEIAKLPILIDETPALTTATIRNLAQKEIHKNGIDLMIVDHIGIIQPDIKAKPYDQMSKIAFEMMAMTKQLDIPILNLCQLSRAVEGRRDKRPVLSDLRESGKLEENADGVMFLYRDDYYNEETEFPNLTEINIAKNRGGATGTVTVYADKKTARFESLEMRYRRDP